MKGFRKWFVSVAVLLIVSVGFIAYNTDRIVAGTHTQGALICSNCHTMHYSMNDPDNPGSWGGAGPYANLLIDTKTNNAICLACHDDRAADTSGAPTVYSVNDLDDTYYPGGDFDEVSADGRNGHFKITGGNLVVDDLPATAPGSNATINSSDLACWSCHDPHNSAAATDGANDFRLLRKRPRNGTTGASYVAADITVTASAASYNDEASTNHTVYHSGISEWCGACHSNPGAGADGFHGSAVGDLDVGAGGLWVRHPTDNTLSAAFETEYELTAAGTDWEVPYQDTSGSWATNAASEAARVTNGTDQVMCLSCHRAHVGREPGAVATYYRDGLRWDPDSGLDSSSGCNKCHDK